MCSLHMMDDERVSAAATDKSQEELISGVSWHAMRKEEKCPETANEKYVVGILKPYFERRSSRCGEE